MKGRFSLNFHEDYILFGNLGKNSFDPASYALTDISYSHKYTDQVVNIIAHDVIEHTIAHRTNTGVTVEEELRAIGATAFVEQNYTYADILSPMQSQMYYLNLDVLRKMPPKRQKIYYETNIFDEISEDIPNKDYWINWANAQVNYGYWQKGTQFNWDNLKAYNALNFIKNISRDLLKLAYDYEYYNYPTGISCYFDTEKETYKTQFKRNYQ